MKRTLLFTAAGLIMCCIVSITTTQAMPNRDRAAPNVSNAASAFNQKKPHEVPMDLCSPMLQDKVIRYDDNDLHGTALARNGRAIEEHPNGDIRRRPVRREDGDGAVYVDNDDDDNNGNDGSDDTNDDYDNDNGNDGSTADDNVNSNNNGNNGGEDDNYFVDDKVGVL